MKIYIKILLITFCLFFIVSCIFIERKCTDNLSAYNAKIPYRNGELVTFVNDTIGERVDTVFVKLDNSISEKNDNEDNCTGLSSVGYSNEFGYSFYQHDDWSNPGNPVEEDYYYYQFCGHDTIYQYKEKSYNAMHVHLDIEYMEYMFGWALLEEGELFYYSDYIFLGGDNSEYKLLEYSTIDTNGVKRKWILKE